MLECIKKFFKKESKKFKEFESNNFKNNKFLKEKEKYYFNKFGKLRSDYKENKTYTEILKFIINNKESFQLYKEDSYKLILKRNNLIYYFWRTSKWYGYLSDFDVYDENLQKKILCEKELGCDLEVLIRFYEEVELYFYPNSLEKFKTDLILGIK